MKSNKQANWTVFFLVKGADKDEANILVFLHELLNTPNNLQNNVIICFNSQIKTIKKIPCEYPNRYNLADEKKNTIFIKLISTTSGNCFGFIDEDPSFNIREKKSVTKFFRSIILENNKAKRYILCTWDHGSAYGIFREINGTPMVEIVANSTPFQDIFLTFKFRSIIENRSLPASGFNNDYKERYKKMLDSEAFDMLTADELKKAIQWAFGKKKIDMVIMMNCFMQYFDTGFALRNNVKCLIAPAALITMSNGFNYSRLLEIISEKPNISIDELSADVILAYGIKANEKEEKHIVVSANNLHYYSTLAAFINKLSQSLINNLDNDFTAIKESISECLQMYASGKYRLRDFFLFCRILFTKKQSSITFSDIVELAILEKKIVQHSYISDERFATNLLPCGLAVFLPAEKNTAIQNEFYRTFVLQYSREATEVSRYFLWDNFIKKFLEKL